MLVTRRVPAPVLERRVWGPEFFLAIEVHPDLLDLDNVTIVPHLGTATVETRVAMGMTAADNLLAALGGRRPPHLLNREAWG